MEDRLAELNQRLDQSKQGGGERRIQQQHERGKLTARERINLLVDAGSFEELDALVVHRCANFGLDAQRYPGDGVVTGLGQVNRRPVYLFAQDFTVLGGSLSETHGQKICKVMDLALKNGAPIIGLLDSGGARIQEGVASLAGYGEIFLRNTLASGVVPQISAIMGPCAGGAVYSPAITDFIFMVKNTSYMFITGPEVIRAVTREEVSLEHLGGAAVQASRSGVAHFMAEDEPQCIVQIKHLLRFLPQNNLEDPPTVEYTDDPNRMDEALLRIIPDDPAKAYDMREVIGHIVDHGDFFEVHQHFAPNILVGFARLVGRVVGVIAQQPAHLAGVLNIDSSVKGARFIRFCDAFNIPLVTLVDAPGFMPGVAQEHGGIIRHGAKLLYAYCEATVPKLTVITRKAYGGAYIAMSSKHLRGDLNLAWPTGDIAVMGAQGAVNIIHREALAKAQDPQAERERLEKEYEAKFANPYVAAERGYLDAVIDPRETRPRLIRALEMFRHKRDTVPPKKHGNIPL